MHPGWGLHAHPPQWRRLQENKAMVCGMWGNAKFGIVPICAFVHRVGAA
ncbi:hypothetical protein ARMA_1894 [Ardenticatena maritima]|uniref:Uncharacterized protein n=1 Tax=Ardenticatena maritima TaxID=872965 RepID=A0A0M9UD18_9CHLR|nr:hypothetical protein ARMA_1894 [Ardenticatena maritima]